MNEYEISIENDKPLGDVYIIADTPEEAKQVATLLGALILI